MKTYTLLYFAFALCLCAGCAGKTGHEQAFRKSYNKRSAECFKRYQIGNIDTAREAMEQYLLLLKEAESKRILDGVDFNLLRLQAQLRLKQIHEESGNSEIALRFHDEALASAQRAGGNIEAVQIMEQRVQEMDQRASTYWRTKAHGTQRAGLLSSNSAQSATLDE